jgi:hypothetical protein
MTWVASGRVLVPGCLRLCVNHRAFLAALEEIRAPKTPILCPFLQGRSVSPRLTMSGPTIRSRFLFSPQAGAPMNLDVLLPQPLTEEERLECLLQRRLGSRIRNVRVQLLPHGRVL